MKKIWITSLSKDQENVQRLMALLKPYGMGIDGHFWLDDLKNMAWSNAAESIMNKDVALWIIVADKASLVKDTIRKGLSMLAMIVQHGKGNGFHILVLADEKDITSNDLPVLLKSADVIPLASTTVGAKVVALANMPAPNVETGYRLTIHPVVGIGHWFEVGPSHGMQWNGVMFGVTGAVITFHGIGPADGIPERSVLEYAMKGLEIKLGDEEFTAWAVQNLLDDKTSYYVRVDNVPDRILFGPYVSEDDAEAHTLEL